MNRRNRLCAKNVAVFQSLFVKHTMKGDSYVRNFRPRGEIEERVGVFSRIFSCVYENKDLEKSRSPNLIQKNILLNIKRTSYGKHTNSGT